MYAKLLGHQNQRQKIQHVKKLKEENMSLKQVNYKVEHDTCIPEGKGVTRYQKELSSFDAFLVLIGNSTVEYNS